MFLNLLLLLSIYLFTFFVKFVQINALNNMLFLTICCKLIVFVLFDVLTSILKSFKNQINFLLFFVFVF